MHYKAYMYHYRLQLAALHYNENAIRKQAKSKQDKLRYSISFPKFKKGGYTVRKLKEKCSYR